MLLLMKFSLELKQVQKLIQKLGHTKYELDPQKSLITFQIMVTYKKREIILPFSFSPFLGSFVILSPLFQQPSHLSSSIETISYFRLSSTTLNLSKLRQIMKVFKLYLGLPFSKVLLHTNHQTQLLRYVIYCKILIKLKCSYPNSNNLIC